MYESDEEVDSDVEALLYSQLHYSTDLELGADSELVVEHHEESNKGDSSEEEESENEKETSDGDLSKDLENEKQNNIWAINDRDLQGAKNIVQSVGNKTRYFFESLDNAPKCHNCNQTGHAMKKCPMKEEVCHLCGLKGHNRWNCPNDVCYNCYETGHIAKTCKAQRKSNYAVCKRCWGRGHNRERCPEIWRQFHLTAIERESLKRPKVDNKGNLKTIRKVRFCYNCGKDGHFGHDCEQNRANARPVSSPFTVFYDKCPFKRVASRDIGRMHNDQDKGPKQMSDRLDKREDTLREKQKEITKEGKYDRNNKVVKSGQSREGKSRFLEEEFSQRKIRAGRDDTFLTDVFNKERFFKGVPSNGREIETRQSQKRIADIQSRKEAVDRRSEKVVVNRNVGVATSEEDETKGKYDVKKVALPSDVHVLSDDNHNKSFVYISSDSTGNEHKYLPKSVKINRGGKATRAQMQEKKVIEISDASESEATSRKRKWSNSVSVNIGDDSKRWKGTLSEGAEKNACSSIQKETNTGEFETNESAAFKKCKEMFNNKTETIRQPLHGNKVGASFDTPGPIEISSSDDGGFAEFIELDVYASHSDLSDDSDVELKGKPKSSKTALSLPKRRKGERSEVEVPIDKSRRSESEGMKGGSIEKDKLPLPGDSREQGRAAEKQGSWTRVEGSKSESSKGGTSAPEKTDSIENAKISFAVGSEDWCTLSEWDESGERENRSVSGSSRADIRLPVRNINEYQFKNAEVSRTVAKIPKNEDSKGKAEISEKRIRGSSNSKKVVTSPAHWPIRESSITIGNRKDVGIRSVEEQKLGLNRPKGQRENDTSWSEMQGSNLWVTRISDENEARSTYVDEDHSSSDGENFQFSNLLLNQDSSDSADEDDLRSKINTLKTKRNIQFSVDVEPDQSLNYSEEADESNEYTSNGLMNDLRFEEDEDVVAQPRKIDFTRYDPNEIIEEDPMNYGHSDDVIHDRIPQPSSSKKTLVNDQGTGGSYLFEDWNAGENIAYGSPSMARNDSLQDSSRNGRISSGNGSAYGKSKKKQKFIRRQKTPNVNYKEMKAWNVLQSSTPVSETQNVAAQVNSATNSNKKTCKRKFQAKKKGANESEIKPLSRKESFVEQLKGKSRLGQRNLKRKWRKKAKNESSQEWLKKLSNFNQKNDAQKGGPTNMKNDVRKVTRVIQNEGHASNQFQNRTAQNHLVILKKEKVAGSPGRAFQNRTVQNKLLVRKKESTGRFDNGFGTNKAAKRTFKRVNRGFKASERSMNLGFN